VQLDGGVDVVDPPTGAEAMSALGPEAITGPGQAGAEKDRTAGPAEQALLRRLAAGLGLRVVALGDNAQLLVSNVSMRLTLDEMPVLARAIRDD
jgi:hypothetical protein